MFYFNLKNIVTPLLGRWVNNY